MTPPDIRERDEGLLTGTPFAGLVEPRSFVRLRCFVAEVRPGGVLRAVAVDEGEALLHFREVINGLWFRPDGVAAWELVHREEDGDAPPA
jgi:hypothetical protein